MGLYESVINYLIVSLAVLSGGLFEVDSSGLFRWESSSHQRKSTENAHQKKYSPLLFIKVRTSDPFTSIRPKTIVYLWNFSHFSNDIH